eukprot:SAG31_NODE_15871_length_734_cov_0.974803_1_plen_232_part_01
MAERIQSFEVLSTFSVSAGLQTSEDHYRQLAVGDSTSTASGPRPLCYYGQDPTASGASPPQPPQRTMFDPSARPDQSSANCEAEMFTYDVDDQNSYDNYAQIIAEQQQRQYQIEFLAAERDRMIMAAQTLAATQASSVAGSGADENPFRTITNKIRVLEANHSATVLAVQGLLLQYDQLSDILQHTESARNAAVQAAHAVLNEHRSKMEEAYDDLRAMVGRDADQIFSQAQI